MKASIILNNDKHNVDLPLPVLPTIPIFSFGFIITFIFDKTIGVFGLYLIDKLSNIIFPLLNKFSFFSLSLFSSIFISLLRFVYSKHLSKIFSSCDIFIIIIKNSKI